MFSNLYEYSSITPLFQSCNNFANSKMEFNVLAKNVVALDGHFCCHLMGLDVLISQT